MSPEFRLRPSLSVRRGERARPAARRDFGREYPGPGWPEGPIEVMTRTYEMVFTDALGGVGQLMKRDPELLEFALGALFRFDPR